MAQQQLVERDGRPCPYCTRQMQLGDLKLRPTNDHLFPKSRTKGCWIDGVYYKHGRIIVVCSECNFMKADLTLREFLASLEAKNKALEEFMRLNKERLENISYLLKIGIEE